ncbi:arginine-tRNA-protein transferase [Limimonas halophila]|uniref:Aspartate/glutamate leucyltransferase n=1 Tax=Limimonas halophila TaxID=1082479 RepID=A0A1G7P0E9_9PROT|nr:arginyltransferase [Limimonas halophila]SDF79704.1 arginine-tRNA-protein transferase [Limimonas halophila]
MTERRTIPGHVLPLAGQRPVLRRFVVLRETPCPYLPDRNERKVITDLNGPDANTAYGELSRAGFRRSHLFAYRPACRGCSACIPVRVVAPAYAPSKSLRRIARKNADLAVSLRPPVATEEQYRLFTRYVQARHAGGDMARMTFADYEPLVEDSAVTTRVAEFRRPDGTLAAGCVVDLLDDGTSAVYSFYDTSEPGRSLGTAVIDWLIRATADGYGRNVYLGYWVPQAPKMAYKIRFRPIELLRDGTWEPLTTPAPGGAHSGDDTERLTRL